MRFCGFFVVLCLTISTVWGLRCYTCEASTKPCSTVATCKSIPLVPFDRCFSVTAEGQTARGCMSSSLCISPITCCEGDLCNNAKYIGPSFFLLVLSSAALYFL